MEEVLIRATRDSDRSGSHLTEVNPLIFIYKGVFSKHQKEVG